MASVPSSNRTHALPLPSQGDHTTSVTSRPADTADPVDSDRCRDRADEGEPDVLLEADQTEPGDADGDREGGPAQPMETG